MTAPLPKCGFYRHHKGNLYILENVVTHSETGEQLAIYFNVEGERKFWARPVAQFCETLPDGRKRFEQVHE